MSASAEFAKQTRIVGGEVIRASALLADVDIRAPGNFPSF